MAFLILTGRYIGYLPDHYASLLGAIRTLAGLKANTRFYDLSLPRSRVRGVVRTWCWKASRRAGRDTLTGVFLTGTCLEPVGAAINVKARNPLDRKCP